MIINSKKGSSAGEQTLTWIVYTIFLFMVIFSVIVMTFLNVTFETDIRSADGIVHAGLLYYNDKFGECDNCEYYIKPPSDEKIGIKQEKEGEEPIFLNKQTYDFLFPIASQEIEDGSAGAKTTILNTPNFTVEVIVKND